MDALDVFSATSVLAISVAITDSETVVELSCTVNAAVFDFVLPELGAPLKFWKFGLTTTIDA